MQAKEDENNILKCSNLGKFYKYINSKLSSKSGIAPLKNAEGKFVFSAIEKANLLNKYFGSVCTQDDNITPKTVLPKSAPFANRLETIRFTTNETYKILQKQKNKFSAGPDEFPPILFKRMARCLAWPITLMNRIIFTCGVLPEIWKHALVTPIFKKGSSSNVANYRPISLTCIACKIFETSIKEQVLKYFLDEQILSESQHGFISKHSTNTNLLQSLNDWTINLKNGHQTRIITIDFARAFDSICFSKLLLKLRLYGLGSSILQIIESFLSNRTQCVVLENLYSDKVELTSGVPQGSVLGPLIICGIH